MTGIKPLPNGGRAPATTYRSGCTENESAGSVLNLFAYRFDIVSDTMDGSARSGGKGAEEEKRTCANGEQFALGTFTCLCRYLADKYCIHDINPNRRNAANLTGTSQSP